MLNINEKLPAKYKRNIQSRLPRSRNISIKRRPREMQISKPIVMKPKTKEDIERDTIVR
jgi:hypothetical protein